MFLAVAVPPGSTASKLSVCDIMHAGRFAHSDVVISGRILFTMHGAFLTTDSCPDSSYDLVLLYPKSVGAPPVPFDLDPSAIGKLKNFFRPSGGTAAACGVLSGRVFYKKRFHSRPEGAGPVGNGFGPRGAFRAAFVLRSVDAAHACG